MKPRLIDNAEIDALIRSPLRGQLNCLQNIPKERKSTCGGCTAESATDYIALKECLASSGAVQLEIIKRHYGVQELLFKIPVVTRGVPGIQNRLR